MLLICGPPPPIFRSLASVSKTQLLAPGSTIFSAGPLVGVCTIHVLVFSNPNGVPHLVTRCLIWSYLGGEEGTKCNYGDYNLHLRVP